MGYFFGRILPARRHRPAFTLIEILVATTVTLLMMAALAVGFKRLGDGITEGRARLNLSDRLRGVTAILRNDLEGLTVHPDPTSAAQSVGYFKYYEGPITDYSATLATMDVTATDPSRIIPDSRYGDTDDILMMTCRAGQDWFRGKIPLAVLKAVQNSALGMALNNGITLADWFTPMVISSEYAEIVYFVEPRRDPESSIGLGLPTDSVVPTIGFLDADSNGIPDEFVLHRRVLLIRPDLNIGGQIFWVDPTTGGNPAYFEQLLAQEPTTDIGNMLGMRYAHTNSDLSIRRVPNSGTASFDAVAANSLEDLRAPENRFGHFVQPMNPTFPASTTMPILALSKPLFYAKGTVNLLGNDEIVPGEFGSRTGFLHPYLTLGEYARSSIAGFSSRLGQDILASNILGFDLRGFDPSVVLFYDGGPDGQSGIAGVDDDNDGTTDSNDPQEFGLAGTDDLVLTPNDPGYASKILSAGSVAATGGAFVDLNWGPKVMTRGAVLAGTLPSWPAPITTDSRWFTGLSGFSMVNYSASGVMDFTTDLYKSGLVVHQESPPGSGTIPFLPTSFHIYQPSYDSWGNSYEVDGQAQKKVNGFLGDIWINHQLAFGGSGDDSAQIDTSSNIHRSFAQTDSGTDGLDNDLTGGPDDVLEKETASPYPFIMPAVQVTVRVEDAGTRLVQQMSVVYDFISQ